LLQMELTTLPGYGREYGPACRFQSFMCVRDKKSYTMKSSVLETTKEIPPMNLILREFYRDTQHFTMPRIADANGNQNRTGNHNSAMANLLVSGIQINIRKGLQLRLPLGIG
jgi:hypothetical protein